MGGTRVLPPIKIVNCNGIARFTACNYKLYTALRKDRDQKEPVIGLNPEKQTEKESTLGYVDRHLVWKGVCLVLSWIRS